MVVEADLNQVASAVRHLGLLKNIRFFGGNLTTNFKSNRRAAERD